MASAQRYLAMSQEFPWLTITMISVKDVSRTVDGAMGRITAMSVIQAITTTITQINVGLFAIQPSSTTPTCQKMAL